MLGPRPAGALPPTALTITSLAARTRCPNQQCWFDLQLTLTLSGAGIRQWPVTEAGESLESNRKGTVGRNAQPEQRNA